MNLNNLLRDKNIDPRNVLVLRHTPHEPELNKVLPWFAVERPNIFNAYQQTQGEKLQKVMKAMVGHGYVASFIGHEPAKAVFIGLYSIGDFKPLNFEQYWKIPEHLELKKYGLQGLTEEKSRLRPSIIWFNLTLTDFYSDWKGKLIINWPPPEISWWRRSHLNQISVCAILEDSVLDAKMPEWNETTFEWRDLHILPERWKSALRQWRGIYYIFDRSDGKGYVGSAYGEENLFGRWLDYAARGHGGNSLLRPRDPQNFQFSILQRVSPDIDARDLFKIENSWKKRLHTRSPQGLNDN
jgi:hypothetical protein